MAGTGGCSVSSRAHVIRYLEHRLSACRAQPGFHGHQIAVYERLLDLARGAVDAGAYYRALEAGDLTLAAVRAEWLDRYRNAACVYAALGDEAQRAAAAARFHAGGQRDFLAAITAVEQQSAAAIAAARASQEALAPMLMSLLDWRIAGHEDLRRQCLIEVRGLWRRIVHGDPGCTWERICAHPPYRARVPFDDAGLALLGAWLAQALAGAVDDPPGAPDQAVEAALPGTMVATAPAEAGEPAAPAEPAPIAPAAPGPAHAYRVVYQSQDWSGRDCTRRVYERIFALEAEVERQGGPADAEAFLGRMAEEDLFDGLARAPHMDWAEELRVHCAGRSQPVMAHHAGALAAAMAARPTATVVEHERMRLDACFHIESAWDQIFVHYALCPIKAVLAGAPGQGAAVRESVGVTAALFGTTWDALLATPRLWAFFGRELVPAMFGRRPRIGAGRGEVGGAMLGAAAGFSPRPAGDAPEDVRDHVAALIATAAGTGATRSATPGPGRALRLWGQPVTLDAVADRLAAPPRPVIALDAAGVTALSALFVPHPP